MGKGTILSGGAQGGEKKLWVVDGEGAGTTVTDFSLASGVRPNNGDPVIFTYTESDKKYTITAIGTPATGTTNADDNNQSTWFTVGSKAGDGGDTGFKSGDRVWIGECTDCGGTANRNFPNTNVTASAVADNSQGTPRVGWLARSN